jgi:hypothetical protein
VRIRWLNADMTEASVTRGWLWWKRIAIVERNEKGHEVDSKYTSHHTIHWSFVASNTWCDRELNDKLQAKRFDNRTWLRRVELPQAKALTTGSAEE